LYSIKKIIIIGENMPLTEGPPVRDDKEDRLTLEDVGARDIGVHPAYRAKQDEVLKNLDKKDKRSNRKRSKMSPLQVVGAAGTAVVGLIGLAQWHASATNSEIDPVQVSEANEQAETPQHVESDLKPGDVVNVLAETYFQFNTSDINVRTSPEAVDASESEDDNLADVPEFGADQTITVLHALVVQDLRNPSNGNWYGFMDSDGKMFYINSLALSETGVTINEATQQVTIKDTTVNGAEAIDANGLEAIVATAVVSA
jgi:hypothetical protein